MEFRLQAGSRILRRSRLLSSSPGSSIGCSDCFDPRKRGTPNGPYSGTPVANSSDAGSGALDTSACLLVSSNIRLLGPSANEFAAATRAAKRRRASVVKREASDCGKAGARGKKVTDKPTVLLYHAIGPKRKMPGGLGAEPTRRTAVRENRMSGAEERGAWHSPPSRLL